MEHYRPQRLPRLASAARGSAAFSPEQAQKFLDAVRGEPLKALYHIAIKLGMRQGGILALTWSTVDLDQGRLSVERTIQRYDGAYHLDEPKIEKSRRMLGLTPNLVDVLRAHRTR